jgi:MFS family permease
MVLIGSLVGTDLAPTVNLATAPVALMILGTAISVVPISACMEKLGRKNTLWLFMGIGIFACGLAMVALQLQSFSLFCLTSLIMGSCNAAILQTRFAGMESVPVEHSATAASMVMAGGIIAAFVGPELAVMGISMTVVPYQGSFLLGAICIGLAALLLAPFKPSAMVNVATAKSQATLTSLLGNPSFCLALASGAVAYIIMSFVMTGTPISMHYFHGHSLLDTKWVIQSHIAAMFLPSFIAPILFKHLKIRGMMLLGLLCYGATIVVGFSDTSVSGFWIQLVLLGVGWNFLFVAGTSLLPSTHKDDDRFKAQAINDFTVFSLQAVAALSAGWVINFITWQQMLLGCLAPMVIMLGTLIWERSTTTPSQ